MADDFTYLQFLVDIIKNKGVKIIELPSIYDS